MLTTLGQKISALFPAGWNPLFHLGAIGFYLFWLVTITGLYLFVFFETSVSGAWQSVETMTRDHYVIGSVMRSVHRYASAALALIVVLHIFREFFLGRFSGARIFSWISGIPLLWLLFVSAIGGYWLVWDQKAQYIALSISRLFDVIPIVVEPLSFGFLSNEIISDRFFTLLIFLHIGFPLALLLGMFIHIKRVREARANPPLPVAVSWLVALILLSMIRPVASMAPADFDVMLTTVEFDWFYLNLFPLIPVIGPAGLWMVLLAITLLLALVPLLVKSQPHSVAVVDPEFCNGCGWCFADCPYEAVLMKPHDFKAGHQQAVVLTDLCVGCGICAGACPSATPFKNFNQAFSGINLDQFNNMDMLFEMKDKVSEIKHPAKILVVGCHHGPDLSELNDEQVSTETLECVGQLPPSYLDYLVRREGVEKVLLTGCAEGDCFHRFGIELQEQRLVRAREPHLKYKDVLAKIERCWIGRGGENKVKADVQRLKDALKEAG